MDETDSQALRRLQQEHRETLSRLKKVEEENESLLKLNELFREELGQKTLALQKSADAYSQLKKQYEELLTRVTELHFEKEKSSPVTPKSSPDLRAQLQILTKRKEEYKSLAVEMKSRISELENERKRTKNTIERFQDIVRPYAVGETILDIANALVTRLETSVTRDKYTKLKKKYQCVLRRCSQLSQHVQEDEETLKKGIAQRAVWSIEDEFEKFERFVSRYEQKSRKLMLQEAP